jgi:hypothetical protein
VVVGNPFQTFGESNNWKFTCGTGTNIRSNAAITGGEYATANDKYGKEFRVDLTCRYLGAYSTDGTTFGFKYVGIVASAANCKD